MQKIIRTVLRGTLVILGLLIIIAIVSLLSHDHKTNQWYTEKIVDPPIRHPDTITTVCILATVHEANLNYNADSIITILALFQPDLILTEEDSAVFETYHKSYNQTLQRPLFARLGRSFGFGRSVDIEAKAVRKYKISHEAIDIRPFDYEGRNAFYEKNNTFFKENAVGNIIESLASSHSLTPEQEIILNNYHKINDTLSQQSIQTPWFINRRAYYELAERRQEYQYRRIAEIVNTHDSLKEYRTFYKSNADFWDIRNKKMAEHIANFIRLYPRKRIFVLTGAMHKYYLVRELAPLQDSLKYRLTEYYE